MLIIKERNIRIMDAVPDHVIDWMARNMRDLDAEAIEVATGQDVDMILRLALKSSPIQAWAYEKMEKKPLCIFGVSSFPDNMKLGIPWMLGSDYIFKYSISLLRMSKMYVEMMKKNFDYLENRVYAKDEVSVKYLEHLGFTIHVPAPWGVNGELFHQFTWSRYV